MTGLSGGKDALHHGEGVKALELGYDVAQVGQAFVTVLLEDRDENVGLGNPGAAKPALSCGDEVRLVVVGEPAKRRQQWGRANLEPREWI
jgi:hypothetical protein